jgi:hypothetical protein
VARLKPSDYQPAGSGAPDTDRSWHASAGSGVASRRIFGVGFERGGSRGRGSPAWGATRGPAPSVGARVASATSNTHPLRHTALRVSRRLSIDLSKLTAPEKTDQCSVNSSRSSPSRPYRNAALSEL